MPKGQSIEERFWSKVHAKPSAGCWLWAGAMGGRGYGQFSLQGRRVGAHRAAWLVATGEHPGDLCVCHHCDNPRCVRPDHLFLGTHSDNMRDRDRKGRRVDVRGERAGRAKLTAADVAAIRADTRPTRVVGPEYGVHPSQISRIRRGKSWAVL